MIELAVRYCFLIQTILVGQPASVEDTGGTNAKREYSISRVSLPFVRIGALLHWAFGEHLSLLEDWDAEQYMICLFTFLMTDLYQTLYNIKDKISNVALLGTLETGIPSHGNGRSSTWLDTLYAD